jgi:cellulose biosynthesis protein BcsQ
MKNKLNIILSPKGGIGKTMISTYLAEFLKDKFKGMNIICMDADNASQSFGQWDEFNVNPIRTFKNLSTELNELIEFFNSTIETKDTIYIVDTGAAEYATITSFMGKINEVYNMIKENNEIVIHTIIGDKQLLDITTTAIDDITNVLQKPRIALWVNDYFGLSPKFEESINEIIENYDNITPIYLYNKNLNATFIKESIKKSYSNKIPLNQYERLDKKIEQAYMKQFKEFIYDEIEKLFPETKLPIDNQEEEINKETESAKENNESYDETDTMEETNESYDETDTNEENND